MVCVRVQLRRRLRDAARTEISRQAVANGARLFPTDAVGREVPHLRALSFEKRLQIEYVGEAAVEEQLRRMQLGGARSDMRAPSHVQSRIAPTNAMVKAPSHGKDEEA